MEFFNQAIDILKILVMALGAGLAVWGVINLLEGYGSDNPAAKSQGMNTFNIVLAVFDVSQHVIQQSTGIIQNGTEITPDVLDSLRTDLEAMELGPLFGLWLQSFLIQLTMIALNIVIFVIVYGRMIEIYLLTSLAPIPFATVPNRETGHMGQNYFRSLFAVGFQGLLILVCVAIYAVLIQSIATDGDPIGAIWGCVGYTVLLCFTLFKTGSLAKSIFGCH